MRITIKQANNVDHTNAHAVTVVDDIADTYKHTIWTAPDGNGLWVDGQQVLGRAQYKHSDSAARRYFEKRYS